METRRRLLPQAARLILLLAFVTACVSARGVAVVPTLPPPVELPPRTPTPTPTSVPLIAPDTFWIGVEGRARAILSVTPSGQSQLIDLPLNEGQQASNVIASAQANALAYLVWGSDGNQRGIALWPLDDPNARLVAQPLPGYRITDLLLTDDGGRIAYTLVQDEVALDEADWRVESVADMSETPAVLASRELLPDTFPPALVAWFDGDSLLLNVTTIDGAPGGIYTSSISAGSLRPLFPALSLEQAETVIAGPVLSPDHTRIAYLAYDGSAPGAPAPDLAPTNVVRIVELSSGLPVTMNPPENSAIYGVRWYDDNVHLVLDVVEFSPEPGLPITQLWARVTIGEPLPWPFSSLGPQRDYLLDYEPFGEGLVFTVLPETPNWELYILTSFENDGGLLALPIAEVAQEGAAPAIIHAP